MQNYILLVDCSDEKGLIHKITGVLYENGLNIISNNEFVEEENDHFFMRSEFIGEVHEHIIIGNNNYFSFADHGYIAQMYREYEKR